MRWNGSAQRDVRSAKEGQVGGGSNLPILRLILNLIPSNAFQPIIAADIRALPYHGQWSGIETDDDESRRLVGIEHDGGFLLFSSRAPPCILS